MKFDGSEAVPADASFDPSTLKGKSVVITGGASGIGEAAVRAFVKAGAFVTFGMWSPQLVMYRICI